MVGRIRSFFGHVKLAMPRPKVIADIATILFPAQLKRRPNVSTLLQKPALRMKTGPLSWY